MAKSIVEFVFVMLFGLAVAIGFGALFAYPEMLLWNNCLVPAAPMLQPITWLQAWGIAVLCTLLFKGNSTSPDSTLSDGIKESNRIAAINSQNIADAANEARQAYSDARDDAKEIVDAIRDRS